MNNSGTPETKIVSGYILRQTEKAIQFECHEVAGLSLLDENENAKQEWFPISQVKSIHKVREQSEMDWIEVAEWLLRKKEMI